MNIFEQEDYKVILRHLMNEKGRAQWGLSRKLADHLRVNPSLVSQVISGPKDFTEEQIVLVCEYFGLPQLESRYVLCLVQLARAGSVQLKNYHLELLSDLRGKAMDLSKRISQVHNLSEKENAKFYSSWIYPAIQLLTTLETKPRFSDICAKFNLDAKTGHEIVGFLIEAGLIFEKNGSYHPGPANTHLEKSSPYIATYHKNWRLKAMQTAERLAPEEFMYSCHFSVSPKDFALLREEFSQVVLKFLKIAQASPAEDLAQFNLDLFWVRG